jgi:hypothetical protein
LCKATDARNARCRIRSATVAPQQSVFAAERAAAIRIAPARFASTCGCGTLVSASPRTGLSPLRARLGRNSQSHHSRACLIASFTIGNTVLNRLTH